MVFWKRNFNTEAKNKEQKNNNQILFKSPHGLLKNVSSNFYYRCCNMPSSLMLEIKNRKRVRFFFKSPSLRSMLVTWRIAIENITFTFTLVEAVHNVDVSTLVL